MTRRAAAELVVSHSRRSCHAVSPDASLSPGPIVRAAVPVHRGNRLDASTRCSELRHRDLSHRRAELIALLVISGWSAYFLRYRDDLAERFGPELRRRDLAVIGTASALEVLASIPILMSINVPLEPSLVAMTALFLVTRTALGHYAEVCRAEAAIATYTIGQMASPVVGCTLSFWAIAEFGSDPRAVLASLTVAQVGGLIVVLRRLGVHGNPIAPDRQLIRSALAYAGPLLAAGGALWIGNNGIRLVVDHIAGPSSSASFRSAGGSASASPLLSPCW